MPLSRRSLIAALAVAPVALALPARAETSPVFQKDGLALGGTDPVSYFTQGQPVSGRAEHQLDWNGATWRFASAENKAAFEADPDRYAPQFGGYCAFGAASGYAAPTVPEAWTIENGKLYLNYSKGVRRRWLKDVPGYISKAEANWPGIVK
jgi:YHS domain-containing protein